MHHYHLSQYIDQYILEETTRIRNISLYEKKVRAVRIPLGCSLL